MTKTKYIFRRSAFFALVLALTLTVVFFTQEQNAARNTVTITEFSDFQCPYCKRAASVVEQVRQAYGERVKVVFKQMPLRIHQHAFRAAQASVCADEQGKFWEYHDRLFASDDLSAGALERIASEVGLSQNQWNQCVAADRSRTRVQADMAEAERLGVSGTPTFFVNGKPWKGANSFAALKREIDGAMLGPPGPMRSISRPTAPRNITSATFQGEQVPRINNLTDSLVANERPSPVVSPSRSSSGMTFSPGTIDFGYVLLGSRTTPFTETVTNSSNAPVLINGISISGRDRGDFSVSYDFTLPVTIAAGQYIKIGVAFSPHLPWKAGTRDANLQITPQKGTFQPVPLTGIGATCGGPLPASSSGCPDVDGDGLNNTWETAAGIDLDNNGVIDATTGDLILAGANPNKPDIYVWYDWMGYGLGEKTCSTNLDCTSSGRYHKGETCNDVGQCVYSCSTDSDCTSRWPSEVHASERCISNVCEHTHDPLVLDANAFQPVVRRFAAHGVNLHILRGNAQPHSHVVSFRDDAQITVSCEGSTGDNVGLGKYAVSFYDLKSRGNPDKRNLAYHFVVFSHYSACDSIAHCNSCPNPGFTYGQTGVAEISGNDSIVSLGGIINDTGVPPHYIVAATFMHELGHNLGIRHDGHIDTLCRSDADCRPGDTCADLGDGQGQVCHEAFNGVLGAEEPNYKPNYLSIMNYRYQRNGIPIAASVGGRVQLRCNNDSDCGGNGALCLTPPANSACALTAHVCESNADCSIPGDFCVAPPVPPNTCSTTGYVCVTDSDCTNGDSCVSPNAPGVCARLDYSSQTLPTGGDTPGALDETNLDDTLGLGSGTSDLFSYTDALCHTCWRIAPTSGPVNWVGTGIFLTPDCSLYLSGVESFTDKGVQAKVGAPDITACDLPLDLLHGHTDWPDLSGISFNYGFQCTPNGSR